ncbi:MAG: hypothetical protein P8Y80_02485 [Acidobacteriota bacterium]
MTEEDGRKGVFVAHLVDVQGRLFLDLYPKESDLGMSDIYKWHFLGFHSFLRVEQVQPILQMTTLDPDWVEKLLKDHPEEISHEKAEDRILLTAKPKELQAFLIRHEDTEDAFFEPCQMIPKE